MTMLDHGEKAPEFSLPDQDGEDVTLADYAGRRVVVYFYPRDDTPGCTKEACQFNDLLARFGALGVDVLGISADDAASHQAFRAKYGLNVRLATDAGNEVMRAYGAYGERERNGEVSVGVIRSTVVVGPDGIVERAWYHVDPDGHAADILAALSS